MMETNEKSLERQTQGFQKRTDRLTRETLPQGTANVNGQGNSPLSARFLAFLEQYVHKLQIRGHKATGLCPFHLDRHPSFSANMEKGVWYCHACGKGGGVKDFALLVGETWGKTRRSEHRSARAYRTALATAREAYRTWERQQLTELIEQYHLLEAEREVAEVGYRAIHRQPDLYTPEEHSFWMGKLASIYDRLAPLEHELDVFTYNHQEASRFAWWREEESGRLSA